jgi:hypothetical protein
MSFNSFTCTNVFNVNRTHAGIVGAPIIPTYIKQSEAFPDPQSAHTDRERERERDRERFTSVSGYWYFWVVSFRISVWETEMI